MTNACTIVYNNYIISCYAVVISDKRRSQIIGGKSFLIYSIKFSVDLDEVLQDKNNLLPSIMNYFYSLAI